jgi:hypothetical protein
MTIFWADAPLRSCPGDYPGSGKDDHYRPGRGRLGVSILPASFKRVQLREMRWVTIAEDAVSEMWLVWSKHREQSHAAQRFKKQLMSASAGRYL